MQHMRPVGWRRTSTVEPVELVLTFHSPGVKLLSVFEGAVEVITDEVLRLHFSGTEGRDVVAIHDHVHQLSRAAARDDVNEKQKFKTFL